MSNSSRFVAEGVSDNLFNGVRTLVETVPSVLSISIGAFVRVGSQYESSKLNGITHFLEHMVFRGTKLYANAKELSRTIEGRGGMLNAYTSKDITCFYIRCLWRDMHLAATVLSELVTQARIDQSDFEVERGVILDEILRSQDDPDSYLWDAMMTTRYPDSAFGRPILGTRETISNMGHSDLVGYYNQNYHQDNLVLSIAGNVSLDQAEQIANKFTQKEVPGNWSPNTTAPTTPTSNQIVEIEDDVEQSHFMWLADGPISGTDEAYLASIVNVVFGGTMYSRLFSEVREQRGLVYAISSFYAPDPIHGMIGIKGGTSHDKWNQVLDVVQAELGALRKNGITYEELELGRTTIQGQMALMTESPMHRMMRNASQYLDLGRIFTTEEIFDKLNKINVEDIQAFCSSYMVEDNTSIVRVVKG